MPVKASKTALSGTQLQQAGPAPQGSSSGTEGASGQVYSSTSSAQGASGQVTSSTSGTEGASVQPSSSISGTEGVMGQPTSERQSCPRRAAAAAASTVQGGSARRNCGARATSREAAKSTAGVEEPHPLYGPNGEIWEHRGLPPILLDLMKPVPKHVPNKQSAADSESLLGFLPPTLLPGKQHESVAASDAANNKDQHKKQATVDTVAVAEVATTDASATNNNKN
jgi:hypothetical protein